MGKMTIDEINVDLFDEVKRLQNQIKSLQGVQKRTIKIVNNVLYFEDSSDYCTALYEALTNGGGVVHLWRK